MPVINGLKKFEAKQRGENYYDDDCDTQEEQIGIGQPRWSQTGGRRFDESYVRTILERYERFHRLHDRGRRGNTELGSPLGLDWHFTILDEWSPRNEPRISDSPSERQDEVREDSGRQRWRAARADIRRLVRARGDVVERDGVAFIADSTVGTESQVALARKAYVQSVSAHYRTRIEEVCESTPGWLVYAPEDNEERRVPSLRDVWQGRPRRPQDAR